MAEATPSARLFLALRPAARELPALTRHADAWRWPAGAARYALSDWHVTLHFLGAVARSRLHALQSAVAVPMEPFELRFGEPLIWPQGLAVLLPLETPVALQRLHDDLGARVRELGLRTDDRPYTPHLTLARRAQGAVPPSRPAWSWWVDGYVLIESTGERSARYRVLQDYGACDTSRTMQSSD